jgi:cytochrome c oxidase subunit 3
VIDVEPVTSGETARPDRSAVTGLISLIAATTMLVAALTSAYIVRRGLGSDWKPLHLPFVIRGGVLLLLFSSLALEIGRSAHKLRRKPIFVRAWLSGVVSGTAFILAQVYGWKQISGAGFSIATSPAAAFLFVITGLFIALVIGAVTALVWSGFRIGRGTFETGYTGLKITAFYWHYLVCLWTYLVILFHIRS